MVNKTRIAALLLLPVILLPAAGCAGNKAKGDTAYVARDVNTLYSEGKKRLDRGRYEEAAIFFDEVERQHPYSVWARRAQLMSAFPITWRRNIRRRSARRSASSPSIRATRTRSTPTISSR